MTGLSAAILTWNEEAFIADCIASLLPLASEIVVIDSGSTDTTREIALAMGARVVEHGWLGYADQRNAALDLLVGADWALFLDADERLTPALRTEITHAAASAGPEIAGFLIPRRNVICGRVMRGGGWWPDYQARLLRPERCRYDAANSVHEHAICDGALLALNQPMVHLNYRTWREFIIRQASYAGLAGRASARRRRRSYLGAPAREFLHRFVGERGYRDGLAGVAASTILAMAKIHEVRSSRARSRL